MIKKYLLLLIGGMCLIGYIGPNISLGQYDSSFPYDIQGQAYNEAESQNATTDFAKDIIKPDTKNQTSLLKRLTNFFRLSGTSYDKPNSEAKALDYIKWILNILLGLVSFISLVMIIFAFYLIFFSKGEDGVAKAKKILIGVGVALFIMGLSWFITSFFFDIFTKVAK